MRRFALFLPIACFMISCAPNSASFTKLNDILQSERTISVPMHISEDGLILLENVRVGEESYTFLLDTGATQSAIFATALERSGLNINSRADTLVHGMVTSENLPTLKVPKLEIGSLKYTQKSLVVLPDWNSSFGLSKKIDGIIGMDILSLYQIYVSPSASYLKLIPNDIPITVPASWDRIDLIANPFKDDNRALHFIEVTVAGKKRPALIDTGAEFSAMNWKSAQYQQIKAIKKRLRKRWELQGAIGTFRPISKVSFDLIHSGEKSWSDKDFVVMDFDALEAIGSSEVPFLIVGMNLFKDETFLIDFERNYIAIRPAQSDNQARFNH